MGFRTVRTAAAASPLLLLPLLGAACAGAGEMEQAATDTVTVTALPDDTVQLTAEQLTMLPRYGAQRLPCQNVRDYLAVSAEESERRTRTVNIELKGGRLTVTPGVGEARRGDTIRWQASDDLSWIVRFKEGRTPLRDGRRTVRAEGEFSAALTRDTSGCGRYVYLVAAYDMARDTVYMADPVWWVY